MELESKHYPLAWSYPRMMLVVGQVKGSISESFLEEGRFVLEPYPWEGF